MQSLAPGFGPAQILLFRILGKSTNGWKNFFSLSLSFTFQINKINLLLKKGAHQELMSTDAETLNNQSANQIQ